MLVWVSAIEDARVCENTVRRLGIYGQGMAIRRLAMEHTGVACVGYTSHTGTSNVQSIL